MGISTSQGPSAVGDYLQVCSPEMVGACPEPDFHSGASLCLTPTDFLGQLTKGPSTLEKGGNLGKEEILGTAVGMIPPPPKYTVTSCNSREGVTRLDVGLN